ncbi:efflux RND transporter periplasmic adaptor subunit [Psychrobacter sp. AOP7-B1-25]|uniref:efflux RND transporter periplasmic adaptor subunit n=1 Tax=Psychrobacter sp. AOP7-B1-25 TaxID=3457644 RepID=UPI00402B8ADE
MRAINYKYLIVILLLIVAVGFVIFRAWRGPLLPSYTITPMLLVQTVVATGRVVTTSRTQIGSEVTGVVLERLVQEGDQVAKGDLLLVLSSDDVAAQVRQVEAELAELVSSRRPQAMVELSKAEVQLAQATRDVARRRELAAISAISDEELEQAKQAQSQAGNDLKAARLRVKALAAGGVEEVLIRERIAVLQAQLDKTKVRSKVAGTVLTRDVEPGDLVQPSKTLFTIALAGNTEIHVPLDERNLSRLALEQEAVAIADAYPDQPFPTRIDFIAPSIDSERGTVEVRLSVDPVPESLRQDMTVSVNIETGRRAQALVIPNDALTNIQKDTAQVRLLRDGKVQRQKITLGLRGLAMSEVVSGLSEGDQVLADATLSLADGERVRTESKEMPLVISSNLTSSDSSNNVLNSNASSNNPSNSNASKNNVSKDKASNNHDDSAASDKASVATT